MNTLITLALDWLKLMAIVTVAAGVITVAFR